MQTLILSPRRVGRTISRLAYEVVEQNRGAEQLVIFGILNKGLPVAEALAVEISQIKDAPVRAIPLDVSAFRDDREDLTFAHRTTKLVDVTRKKVLLVDDVLYTGRTARAALDAIVSCCGRPASIQLAVLVDRGYREVPVQPDYIGRTIHTKAKERVVVAMEESCAIYVEE